MVAVAGHLVTPRYGHFGGSAAGTPNFANSNCWNPHLYSVIVNVWVV